MRQLGHPRRGVSVAAPVACCLIGSILAGATASLAAVSSPDALTAPIEMWQPWLDRSLPVEPGVDEHPVDIALARSGTLQRPSHNADVPPVMWTEVVLRLVVKYQQNPLRAARALTYLHASIHDALILGSQAGLDSETQAISAHGAAAKMLAHLYPHEPLGRFGAMGRLAVAEVAGGSNIALANVEKGWRLGEAAALTGIERTDRDGADRGWDPKDRPAMAPGIWQAAAPLNIYKPLEPLAPHWRTWVLEDASEPRVPPPVSYDSPEYWDEAAQVQAVALRLTAEQKHSADAWNLDKGSTTPAGVWNLKAVERARTEQLTPAQAARLFAALNVGMMDALIACWKVKYTYWTERPITAIRAKYDPAFLPYLITPPFPGYVSGHASVSGAAAEILSAFFPEHSSAFHGAAIEAAQSRLYGGIHFPSDNQQGLKLGAQVGHKVVRRIRPPAGATAGGKARGDITLP